MEVGIVRQINIDNEMQASYLDYAMSVIVARALPDVRDGLKPVHRRILYAMQDLGLTHDKPYKKSARIVGEVLGKYHPHGDAAVYEAMVRMAQDFSLRYPLVDGQGNFGSVDGDNAAAMRYTEARLSAIADEMLTDLDKDTIDWNDNFDGTLKEPSVLPAALPNLIVNGSSGIAVGMATNIPPHNLGEVCDALCYLIDNYTRVEDATTEDLMRFIQGPDFPTGGVIFRYEHAGPGEEAEQVDAIERAYGTGRGSLVVQAKAHIEEMSRNRSRIVVTELPYQTDKSRLVERIAELVRDGRIEGITDLRDESDRTGMRLCIEMTRNVDPRQVLADLYKLTPLQSTFGVSLLALVDGEPRYMGLKKMLQHYLEHRREVILRRSKHDLKKAKEREHILAALLRALDVLDEIIALIRRSRTAEAARLSLMREYQFDEVQAQAILDMQLRRLAALERQKLQDEYKQIVKLIKELEALIADPKKVLALIKQNLIDLKARYGDARRTQIADRVKAVLTAREHAVERNVWVTLGADGRLSSMSRDGDEPASPAKKAAPLPLRGAGAVPALLLPANTRQDVYLFGAGGRAARVLGHQLPDGAGALVAELADLKDRVVAMLAFAPAESDDEGAAPAAGYLLLGTALGKVKRLALADLFAQAHTGPQVIGLDAGDELAWAADSQGEGEVMLVTALGQAIRFAEDEVRPMGLPAGGVGGIKLREGDRVVAGLAISKTAAEEAPGERKPAITRLALISKGGFGKQVALADFPAQGRYGGGVAAAKVLPKSGNIAGAALLAPDDHLVCLTARGASQVLAAPVLPVMARAAQGKAIPALSQLGPIERIYAVKAGAEPAPNGGRNGNGDGSLANRGGAAPGMVTDAARTRARRSGPADGNGVGPAGGESATTAKTARRTGPSVTAGAASPETAEKARAKAGRKRVADQAETAPVRPTRNGRAKASAAADEGTPPAKAGRKRANAAPTGGSTAATPKRGAAAKTDMAPGSSPAAARTRAETHASAAAGSPQPSRMSGKPVAAKAAGESASAPAPKRGAAAQAKAEPGSAEAATRTKAQTSASPAASSARPERASRKPTVTAADKPRAKTAAKEPGEKAGKETPAATPARGAQLPLVASDDLPAPQAHQAPAPRPRHSAADGPMTWPRVPDEEEDHRRNPPPPRRHA